jgi:hypothetical protein
MTVRFLTSNLEVWTTAQGCVQVLALRRWPAAMRLTPDFDFENSMTAM